MKMMETATNISFMKHCSNVAEHCYPEACMKINMTTSRRQDDQGTYLQKSVSNTFEQLTNDSTDWYEPSAFEYSLCELKGKVISKNLGRAI